jgi:hypothetical protein
MTVKTQNTHFVSVPPRSSGADIHAAINRLDGGDEEVGIMAAGLEFATPREVCGLRALLDHASANAARVEFDCPSKETVHRYLERVDFYKDLPGNVELSKARPKIRRTSREGNLIELVRIGGCDDVEQLMDRVSKVAARQLKSRHLAMAFATAIGAATENVVEHANSPTGALVTAQRYATTGLELAVVDLGDGIPKTLARNREHRELDDLSAVAHALEDGVSSIRGEGRGTGLWELRETVRKGGNSTLGIGSGEAELSLSWEDGDAVQNASIPAHPIRGTWIWVRLEG